MRYLLDTNVCISFINGARPELTRRILAHRASDLGLSAITAAELRAGVAKSQHRVQSLRRYERFRSELTVVPFDERAAEAYGSVRADLEKRGTPIGPLDTLIAAHALALDLTLVTHNLREFRRVKGLKVESWVA